MDFFWQTPEEKYANYKGLRVVTMKKVNISVLMLLIKIYIIFYTYNRYKHYNLVKYKITLLHKIIMGAWLLFLYILDLYHLNILYNS